MMGENLRDNVIQTGDQAAHFGSVETLTIQTALFIGQPKPGETDPRRLLWTYLNQVVTDTGKLDLSGVDRHIVSDQQDTRLELAAVYTALDTVRSSQTGGTRVEKLESTTHPKAANLRLQQEFDTDQRRSALSFAAETP